jgi:hypothetical protein
MTGIGPVGWILDCQDSALKFRAANQHDDRPREKMAPDPATNDWHRRRAA